MHCTRTRSIAMWQLLCWLCLLADGGHSLSGMDGGKEELVRNLQKRGVMDGLNEGLKFAGQMFGVNTAADVANLVAKAFSSNTASSQRRRPDFLSNLFQLQPQQAEYSEEAEDAAETQQPQEQPAAEQQDTQQSVHTKAGAKPGKEVPAGIDFTTTKLITNVLRMIGFDASKLGALAINALIMIAQAIGNTLMAATNRKQPAAAIDAAPDAIYDDHNAHQPRAMNDDTPIDWFLHKPNTNNQRLRGLLSRATDSQLPDQVLGMIEQLEEQPGQGACLKLLMCKSTPFIWGMQKSLQNRNDFVFSGNNTSNLTADENTQATEEHPPQSSNRGLNPQVLFKNLPTLSEYRAHGAVCEQRFANYCSTTASYQQQQHQLKGQH